MVLVLWLLTFAAGVGLIVWGAEAFAEHLGRASVRLGVSSFALTRSPIPSLCLARRSCLTRSPV